MKSAEPKGLLVEEEIAEDEEHVIDCMPKEKEEEKLATSVQEDFTFHAINNIHEEEVRQSKVAATCVQEGLDLQPSKELEEASAEELHMEFTNSFVDSYAFTTRAELKKDEVQRKFHQKKNLLANFISLKCFVMF